MPVSYRLLFLMLPLLLSSFGNFVVVVVGQSPVDPAVSVYGNSPPPSGLPSEAVPVSDPPLPSPDVQSQPTSVFTSPTPTSRFFPPTPTLRSSTNPPSEAAVSLPSTALTPVALPPPVKTTPPLSTLPVSPAMVPSSSAVPPAPETTLPTVPRRSPSPSFQSTVPSRAATTIPVNIAPPIIPQRCQVTFGNKLDDVMVTDVDPYSQRSNATKQLAALCEIPPDRITNLSIESNSSGNLVLRFTIEQGWPVYTDQAVQNLKDKLNASTPALQLTDLPLTSPVAIFWTDNGPCPTDACLNNGTCNVTISGDYTCSCDVSHTGSRCQDDVTRIPQAATTIPVNTAPPSTPQRCQLTFGNKLEDVKITDYDLWTQRSEATNQLAALCEIPPDRITNLGIVANDSGNLVLRFTIEQGWPVYTDQAVQNLEDKLKASTPALKLAGLPLTSPVAIFWTDNGPCPTDVCLNNGICDVTLSGNYTCSCDGSHTGPRCQDDAQPLIAAGGGRDLRLLALLVLLAIPIAVAVIVGFHFGRRRQEKEQLRRAFDLRDVRTMGPKSMLSLPMESGIRNDMYDTRSFALAFTDTTFSKAGGGSLTPPASSSSTNTTTSTTSSITKGDDNDNGGDGLF